MTVIMPPSQEMNWAYSTASGNHTGFREPKTTQEKVDLDY